METAAPPPSTLEAPDGQPREPLAPLFVVLGAALLYFLRLGYSYGYSDQDEILPYLFHRMDPSVFTQDWFIQTQVNTFSVRTYFVWMLNAFSIFLPVWLVVLVFHITAWLLVASAVYALTHHFTRDRIASAAAVVVTLVATPVWTLGGNELVHSMLVPSTLAWGLGLWAVYFFFHARFLVSPVLLGVTCWIQALVGLQLAGLLFVLRMAKVFDREATAHTMGGTLLFGALFALWASPALGPIIYQQLVDTPANPAAAPNLFYVLAAFRLPHHYLFLSFPPSAMIRFGLLAALGLGAYAYKPYRRRLHDADFIVRALFIIGLLCTFAFVFTELVPVVLVAKLQLFKMTVFAKLLLVILICGFAASWLPERIRDGLDRPFQARRWSLAAVVAAWALVLTLALNEAPLLRGQIQPLAHRDTPIGHLEDWVRRQTSHDSIFAVPPSFDGFRSRAQRTIVINFKSIPYEDEQMRAWYERLTDFAPVALPERGGSALLDDLDAAFNGLDAATLLRLQEKYDFDYVIRSESLPPGSGYEEVYAEGEWRVYRSPVPEAPANEPTTEG